MTTLTTTPDYTPLAMINALAYCARRFGYEFVQSEMLQRGTRKSPRRARPDALFGSRGFEVSTIRLAD